MTVASREACLSYLRRHAFGLGAGRQGPPRIGAEVELIPVERENRRIARIDANDRPSSLAALRAAAPAAVWTEYRPTKSGASGFLTASGGRITFEPGGQLEYASPPAPSVSALVADLRREAGAINAALTEAGLDPVYAGVDPVNRIEHVPLQIHAERYRRMDAHFATIGRDGARMMRQTASVQINIDLGPDPLARWGLLNALAPYLAALFANASWFEGRPAGEASVRRRIWGALDPRRTGLPCDLRRPVEAYGEFAVGAAAILGAGDRPPFPPFSHLVEAGTADEASWREHLSTLFPEIRPRGYFEVRSIDAMDPQAWVAPLVLIAGLTHDRRTAVEAADLLGPPDASLLARAGRVGLDDAKIAAVAADLVRLALRGARSLGDGFIGHAALDEARAWFERPATTGPVPATQVAVAAG